MEKRNVCDSYCGTVCTTGAVGCFYFFLAHVKSWFAFRKLDFNGWQIAEGGELEVQTLNIAQ